MLRFYLFPIIVSILFTLAATSSPGQSNYDRLADQMAQPEQGVLSGLSVKVINSGAYDFKITPGVAQFGSNKIAVFSKDMPRYTWKVLDYQAIEHNSGVNAKGAIFVKKHLHFPDSPGDTEYTFQILLSRKDTITRIQLQKNGITDPNAIKLGQVTFEIDNGKLVNPTLSVTGRQLSNHIIGEKDDVNGPVFYGVRRSIIDENGSIVDEVVGTIALKKTEAGAGATVLNVKSKTPVVIEGEIVIEGDVEIK